jgi:hypothetical protein
MPAESIPNYISYLVRLWRSGESNAWRATLQDPHTGQQFRFETVESLFVFLQDQLGQSVRAPAAPSDPDPAKEAGQV